MTRETEQFDIAFGRCRVRDGTLLIDRSPPEEIGRRETFRNGVTTVAAYRPRFTAAWLGGSLILLMALIFLLADIYASTPAAAPLVGLLGLTGVLAVAVPLEFNYRRATRARRRLRAELDDEFPLVRPERVRLNDVTGVAVRPVSTGLLFGDGTILLVHFRRDGGDATTFLGVPSFMAGERATACEVFERHGIPVTDER